VLVKSFGFAVHVCDDKGQPSKASFPIGLKGSTTLNQLIVLCAKHSEDKQEKWEYVSDDGYYVRLWYRAEGSEDDADWQMIRENPATGGKPMQRFFANDDIVLMVEARRNGFWHRVDEEVIAGVQARAKQQKEVEDMPEEEWRTALTVGNLCDHGATEVEGGALKYKEAVVKADDGETLTLEYRGLKQPAFVVERADVVLCKPYSKARDWRNQLRTNTKLEVHRSLHTNKTVRDRKPVYLSDSGEHVMYRDGTTEEWWICDKKEYDMLKDACIGYFHLPDVKIFNPLDLNDARSKVEKDAWNMYNKGRWGECPLLRINPVEGAGTLDDQSGYEGLPKSVMVEGHVAHHPKMMGQYTWVPAVDFFEATCKRIDRKHGVIDIAVKPATKYSTYSYSSYWDNEKIVQDVSIYGDDIIPPKTYCKKAGSASAWNKSEKAEGDVGKVGLKNLGNTCFMNSMLQCLNAAVPLQEYFLEKKFEEEINTKNALGTGGILAESYGSLVEEMWSGQFKSVGPTGFKDVLGQVAPQFAGYQQQDSMELFQFLLDNLHEDLNRVIDKPAVPPVEDGGRPDAEVAGEAWESYRKRNQSQLVDLMYGQMRSHLTCPKEECGNEARKFDPYNSVSLSFPEGQGAAADMEVILYKKGCSTGIKYKFPTAKGAVYRELMDQLAEKTGINIDSLAAYDVWSGRINKTQFTPGQKV